MSGAHHLPVGDMTAHPPVGITVGITVVMPVFNAMRFLRDVVPPLISAGRAHGGVEFVFVDNGSTDGSLEYLQAQASSDVRVLSQHGASISALRNLGARTGSGPILSFIDADCEISDGYFREALADLDASGAAATGCAYDIPAQPGWIEQAWHDLHYHVSARNVEYINAGNFVVRRDAFNRVGGFREDLLTGEDAELGQRMNAAGLRIHANPRVRAIHLGNPKTISQFYRRGVWHSVGMFGTVKRGSIDKPTLGMFLHLAMTLLGLSLLFAAPWGTALKVAILAATQLAVPVLTVLYRASAIGRVRGAGRCVVLYWFYYWARLHALALIASGQAARYRK